MYHIPFKPIDDSETCRAAVEAHVPTAVRVLAYLPPIGGLFVCLFLPGDVKLYVGGFSTFWGVLVWLPAIFRLARRAGALAYQVVHSPKDDR